MNTQRHAIGPIIRAAMLAAATVLIARTGLAATRCDAPADHVDRAACAKAKQGPDALRDYVARTQALYQLYYWDYITPAEVDRFDGLASNRAPAKVALGN